MAIAGLSGSYVVPLDNEVIQYATRPIDDPVTRLKKKISSGEVKLTFEDGFGYLRSVLKALDIPVESQVMVFTKTSFQAPRINPRMPRALYFNDRASVGFVRGGDVLEIASHDPKQGVIFYTIDQEPNRPKIERNDTCLQCHHSGGTLGVPGLFVSSVYPDSSGMPLFQNGTFVVNQNRAFAERWGGWYVTGTHGKQTHRGNAVVRDKNRPDQLDTEGTQNQTDLNRFFDTGAYLSPHSDIVALMVLEHQTHMTNLITRVGFEARMAVHSSQVINKALGEPVDQAQRIDGAPYQQRVRRTTRIHALLRRSIDHGTDSWNIRICGSIRKGRTARQKWPVPARSRYDEPFVPLSLQLHDLLGSVRQYAHRSAGPNPEATLGGVERRRQEPCFQAPYTERPASHPGDPDGNQR